LGKIAFDRFEIVCQAVELAQVTLHCQTLIPGQDLFGKPGPALGATQILMRAGRDQMGVQDRLNDVLQPRALAHDLVASRYLAAECLSRLVGDPDLRQEAAGIELGQYAGIDPIGLDLRMRNKADLLWIGDTTRLT